MAKTKTFKCCSKQQQSLRQKFQEQRLFNVYSYLAWASRISTANSTALLILTTLLISVQVTYAKFFHDQLVTPYFGSHSPPPELNLEIPLDSFPIQEEEYYEPIPYALSATYLTHLAKTEENLYGSIKNYKSDLEDRIRLIDKYVNHLYTSL